MNTTDTMLLWLMKGNRKKFYQQIIEDTKKGTTGIATEEELRERANNLANLIQENAQIQAGINSELSDRIENESGVLLYIDSSRGTVFKNNDVETRLTVVIYKGGQRITNANEMREVFGNSARLEWSWQRMDDNTFGVILASDSRIIDDGFTFILSAADVDVKVTFNCQLIVD